MSDVYINREDRGIDWAKLEKIIEIMKKQAHSAEREILKEKTEDIKKKEKEAYEHFHLINIVKDIESLNEQIENLKKKLDENKKLIRSYCQTKENSYGQYNEIRDGSNIYNYIHNSCSKYDEKIKTIKKISSQLEDEIWFAPNIEAVNSLFVSFKKNLNDIK